MPDSSLTRLLVFLAVFLTLALLQKIFPRRPLAQPLWRRWANNFAMLAVGNLLVALLMGGAAVGAALYASRNDWGLLPWLGLPPAFDIVLTLLALDLLIYLQHVLFHRVPLLWRAHRVHHTDRDLDASSALRFHPLEIILSMLIKIAAVLLLGAPPLAVLLFEAILNGMAIFNHANLNLPKPLDKFLRRLLVTPDMHRVHHSVHPDETDSNFGFNLSLWDRLFNTYRQSPRDGQRGMTLGLREYLDQRPQHFLWLLALPFRDPPRPRHRSRVRR